VVVALAVHVDALVETLWIPTVDTSSRVHFGSDFSKRSFIQLNKFGENVESKQ